jgi:hypothetical protein
LARPGTLDLTSQKEVTEDEEDHDPQGRRRQADRSRLQPLPERGVSCGVRARLHRAPAPRARRDRRAVVTAPARPAARHRSGGFRMELTTAGLSEDGLTEDGLTEDGLTEDGLSKDAPLALHPLVFLEEGDEVTIGRTDTDSYAIFPPDGAEAVRQLQAGLTPREVGDWYAAEYGEPLDLAHLVGALDELGFLGTGGRAGADDTGGTRGTGGTTATAAATPTPTRTPIRGRRLGAVLFSLPAWAGYLALVTWAVVAAVRSPDLVPTYRSVFFTDYYAVMEVVLILGVLPLLLGHEAFHVLAARRIGVRSTLGIGRRLYFLVLETRMDGLVAVPRRKRYLPILAGILFDTVAIAALVVTADLTRSGDGRLSLAGRLCLAFAFTTVLRIVWQFYLYLRTDLYILLTTVLGCVDLYATTRKLMADHAARLLRRGTPRADRSGWHPVDRRVARWWVWCVVAGYAFNIGTLLLAVLPILLRIAQGLLSRVTGHGTTTGHLLDATVFLTLTTAQVVISSWLSVRDRRRRTTLHHVLT